MCQTNNQMLKPTKEETDAIIKKSLKKSKESIKSFEYKKESNEHYVENQIKDILDIYSKTKE